MGLHTHVWVGPLSCMICRDGRTQAEAAPACCKVSMATSPHGKVRATEEHAGPHPGPQLHEKTPICAPYCHHLQSRSGSLKPLQAHHQPQGQSGQWLQMCILGHAGSTGVLSPQCACPQGAGALPRGRCELVEGAPTSGTGAQDRHHPLSHRTHTLSASSASEPRAAVTSLQFIVTAAVAAPLLPAVR